VTFWASAPTSLLWYASCLELLARIAKMKCNASGEQADGLTSPASRMGGAALRKISRRLPHSSVFEMPTSPPDSLPGLLCFWPREKRRCRWPRGQSLAAANNVCGSGDLLPPSPPAEKATARQDQAEQTSTDDGAWNRHRVVWKERALALNSRRFGTAIICCTVLPKMHFSLHDN